MDSQKKKKNNSYNFKKLKKILNKDIKLKVSKIIPVKKLLFFGWTHWVHVGSSVQGVSGV